jgi:hypothetical protein
VFKRCGSWLWHGVSVGFFFLLRVLFGYGSIVPGEWVPADIHSESFVGRYGAVFRHTRGPETLQVQPTFEWNADSGKIDRGSVQDADIDSIMASGGRSKGSSFKKMKGFSGSRSNSSASEDSDATEVADQSSSSIAAFARNSRNCCVPKTMRVSPALHHAADILRALSGGITIAKMVLAANIMAGLSGNSSVDPKSQIIAMLILTVLEFLYVRFLCPVADPWELIPRALSLCCDAGTFTCSMILAVISTTEIETINTLGWCMLIFQLSSFLLNAVPPCVWLCAGFYSAVVKIIKGKTAADEFVAVVKTAMKADPNVLVRKYADKWMVKALGRGLLGRRLMHFEKPKQALPFDAAASVKALGRGVTVTREQIKKLRALKRSNINIQRNRGHLDGLVGLPSELLGEENIGIDAGVDDTAANDNAASPSTSNTTSVANVVQKQSTEEASGEVIAPSVSIEIDLGHGEQSDAADVLDGCSEIEVERAHKERMPTRSATLSGRRLGERIASFEMPRSRPVFPASTWRKPEEASRGAAAEEFSPSCRITGGAWHAPSGASLTMNDGDDTYEGEDEGPSKPKRIWWKP